MYLQWISINTLNLDLKKKSIRFWKKKITPFMSNMQWIFLEGIFLKESLKKHYQKLFKYKNYKNLFCTLEPLDWKSVISELKIGHLEQKLLQGILCVYRWMPTLSATPRSYQDREERGVCCSIHRLNQNFVQINFQSMINYLCLFVVVFLFILYLHGIM